ncbi:PepSY-associated TM helix domain-containing protein [Priestia taiwanensis]|uniref:Membrane protein n=1 Tax=Priestia taiwanensis TaxID=1347902 RepID=A0A917EQ41_9BACI|nr:PepSY domain-containing protein [Priestia taiwanensis]MBM7363880.1 putative iron-regulated membrane protein [Priestia taiwanensis]GGE69762.1 membrane protein [Priestia taiwanensis]
MGVAKEEVGSLESSKRRTRAAIYQTVWRWHFYAGLIFSPFLIILAFSGGVYVFKPQIESVLYKDQYYVQEVGEKSLPYSTLVSNVQDEYPDGTIRFVKQYEEVNRTIEVGLLEDEHMSSVFVDPYSGAITGSINNEERFTEIFVKLHSELIVGGTAANYLVELAACWAIILLITGLYVWWPRNKASVWGTILPRLRSKGKTFWRDMHAVPAFWLSIGILLLIMTGLPWSAVLGPQIQKVSVPPEYGYSYGEKPTSITYTKDVAVDIPWANETLPVPSSTVGEYVPLTVDEIHSIAKSSNIATPYAVSMPAGKEGVYIISSSYIPNDLATIHVDQYSGAILSDVRFADFGLGAKLVETGIAFHEGRLFGLANQLLGLVICVGLIFIIVSSFVMWRKRKPEGKLGAPSKSKDKKVTRTVFFIMLVLGIVMPLVGISILVVWLLDFFVLSKVKQLHQWFN